jgi:hypothetical protein
MAIEINKGIEPFDDQMDFSRGNKDRKPYGKSEGTDQFHLGNEYDVAAPVTPPVVETPALVPSAVVAKFTHKLSTGETIEADSIDALATLIEKAVSKQAPPAPVSLEFEDKPLYAPMEFKRKELTLAEQADILNLWKENPQAAMRKLQEAEFGAPVETVISNLSRAEQRELNRRQEEAGVEFLGECETYNPTRANAKKLTDLLASKGKPITKHNLVVAFNQLVAGGDKALVRTEQAAPPAAEEPIEEQKGPPTIVPSNQGLPGNSAPPSVDAAKFAALPLSEQKKFFADLRRRA